MLKNEDIKTTWELTKLLGCDDNTDINEKLLPVKNANYAFINKWKKRKDYLQDPQILKEALDEYENLNLNFGIEGNIGYYTYLRSKQENDNTEIKAKLNKISDYAMTISNDIDFFTHKISRIKKATQKAFLDYEGLAPYKHFLEQLFANAKYILSEKEEKIMTLTSKSSYANWVRMVSTALSLEEAEVIDESGATSLKPFAEISKLMNSNNKDIRDGAAVVFNKILTKHIYIAENEINSILNDKKINDELRGMKRPDLGSLIGDDIDTKTVDTLTKCVVKRFKISSDYYKLKAKLLGMEKLQYHERNVNYGNINTHYSFEDAVNLVQETFYELDTDFGQMFEDFIKNGHFDVFPKKGKTNGGFCTNLLNTQPTFILINYTGELEEVLTIAHEMGHAINAELIKKQQNSLNSGTSLAVAEVASTFMEDFVLRKLMQTANKEEQLALIMMKLNSDISSIHRQIACYTFEYELHTEFRSKGYLSSSDISTIFSKHMSAYMGDSVIQDEGSKNWWVYWSHIRTFFYTYSYANGLLISKALQHKVHENPNFIFKVKEFLAAGSAKSPKDIFANLSIDITSKDFWNDGLDEIQELLDKATQLATELNKI